MIKRIVFSIFLVLWFANPGLGADGARVIEGITADMIRSVGLDITGVTDGNIPYMQSAAAGFGDSPLTTDGTDVTAGNDLTATQNIAGATYGSDKSISDAELLGIDNVTGSGDYVLAINPTLTGPEIGAATGTSLDLGTTTKLESRKLTVDTGGVFNVDIGSAAGDDFTVDTDKFVVEGDTGNVGIGTSVPNAHLDMRSDSPVLKMDATSGTSNYPRMKGYADRPNSGQGVGSFEWWNNAATPVAAFYVERGATDSKGQISFWTSNSPRMIIDENGKVGIGTTSPQEKLHVIGNIRNSALAGTGNRAVYSTADGNLTNSSSDRSLKTNIESIPYGLTETMKMSPVRFNWNDTSKLGAQKEIGFIAQDMETVVSEVVGMNADGMKSLDYPKLTAVLCKAIQEQQAQIASLIIRIETLEGGGN